MVMNSISVKLFLALFGLTSLVLIASIGLARWSFTYGFNDYLHTVQVQRLERASEELVKHYINNGGRWNADTQTIFSAVVRPESYIPDPRWGQEQISERVGIWWSREREPQTDLEELQRVGGRKLLTDAVKEGENVELEPIVLTELGPWPPKNSTVLLDVNGKEIAKTRSSIGEADFISLPITIDNIVIGELRAVAQPEHLTPTEKAFSTQQKLISLVIVAASLALAAIASWLLSRMMLAPIVKVKDGIAQLANGNYKSDLSVDRNDELGMLMNHVNKLGTSLQKNRESRRHFLADISHELRTPMTVLGGEIEALKDGVRPLDMSSVDSLDSEVSRLKLLIDDLYQLSLSDIGGLRYEFTRMDISNWLNKLLEQHRNRVEAAGLKLDINAERAYFINGDKQRLTQLVVNLINNSIAYTDSPGKIQIELKHQRRHIVLSVNDSGPGVSEEQLSRMFEPLFRGEESRDRRVGGAGLGLTICRNIVVAHDAAISAASSDLGGVAIEIKFPRQ